MLWNKFLGVFYFGAQFYIPPIYFDVCCEPQMLVRALWSLYTDTVLEATKYMSKSILSYSKYILYLKSTAYILGVYICETICRRSTVLHPSLTCYFSSKRKFVLVCSVSVYTENFLLWRCFYILENSLAFSTFYSASTIGDKGGEFYSGLKRRFLFSRFRNMFPFLPVTN